VKRPDTTAVIDELPQLGVLYDYIVIGGRVCAHCISCGDRFDTIGRPARAIKLWAFEHAESAHALELGQASTVAHLATELQT